MPPFKVSRSRRESEEIIVHDSDGHEHHITVEEALEEVMVESERTRHHSMMGMFGHRPNKLDFDYEKHFPEHDFLQVHDDNYLPPGANSRPRPVRATFFNFQISEVQKSFQSHYFLGIFND